MSQSNTFYWRGACSNKTMINNRLNALVISSQSLRLLNHLSEILFLAMFFSRSVEIHFFFFFFGNNPFILFAMRKEITQIEAERERERAVQTNCMMLPKMVIMIDLSIYIGMHMAKNGTIWEIKKPNLTSLLKCATFCS